MPSWRPNQLAPEPYLTPEGAAACRRGTIFAGGSRGEARRRGRTYRALRQDRSVDSGAGFFSARGLDDEPGRTFGNDRPRRRDISTAAIQPAAIGSACTTTTGRTQPLGYQTQRRCGNLTSLAASAANAARRVGQHCGTGISADRDTSAPFCRLLGSAVSLATVPPGVAAKMAENRGCS